MLKSLTLSLDFQLSIYLVLNFLFIVIMNFLGSASAGSHSPFHTSTDSTPNIPLQRITVKLTSVSVGYSTFGIPSYPIQLTFELVATH